MTETRRPEVSDKWVAAQEGEKQYWERVTGDGGYLDRHADDFRRSVPRFLAELSSSGFEYSEGSRALQIGSGLFDLIDFLDKGERYALEPLEHWFSTLNDDHRDRSVVRFDGPAESIPMDDGCLDLVISHNMLDHVSSPSAVLRECRRVLRDEGRLWLRVHVFRSVSVIIKRVLFSLQLDTKHLFFWTGQSLRREIAEAGFEILKESFVNTRKPLHQYLRRLQWKPAMKTLAGVFPIHCTLILKPTRAPEREG